MRPARWGKWEEWWNRPEGTVDQIRFTPRLAPEAEGTFGVVCWPRLLVGHIQGCEESENFPEV